MSAKNALLLTAAIAVLGMGVYLFIQVRATPAQAGASHTQQAHNTTPPPKIEEAHKPRPEAEAPPVPGSTRTSWTRGSGTGETKSGDAAPSVPAGENDNRKVDLKVDNLMELANKAYDSQDFDQATAIAGKVLAKDPNNVRMLRIMVSANCIQGDSVLAQQHYERLPAFDREQMKARCDRYGVTFKEPP